ncbi:YceI family protein [Leptospira perolatii]|uniref:YceI family protein n=1 Tax=Leptospira perolatii TaxID=2023191 RepID=UPI001FAE8F33|nr:YceI family protein [Leptospira perolatii]
MRPLSSKFHIIIGLSVCWLLLGDCKPKTPAVPQPGVCKFTFSPADTSLEWKAFKFTDKAGVGGKFTKFKTSGTSAADSQEGAIAGLAFEIDSKDVDSGNPDRDAKIKSQFFGTMKEKGMISGSLLSVSVSQDRKSGTGNLKLRLNGIEKEIPLTFVIENGDVLKVKGSINVNDWNATSSLNALNQVCKDLHTGKDGKSVLWPDVEISIQTRLKSECNDQEVASEADKTAPVKQD